MFTDTLAKLAEARGVKFCFSTTIERVLTEAGNVSGIATSAGLLKADAYIVALGSYSPMLLRPLGISVPVYPVKGYSITVPIKDAGGAPVSTVMDESYKIAITRLGDRIRVGGTAEVSGYDLTPRKARRATLEHSVGDLFPRGGNLAAGTFWCGLRPMTPDGPPLICGTRLPNLYLNTGHGTLGWTMACGSGRVIADVVSGKRPEIDISGLDLGRYGR
jgi:D-amino-acid dehydrogenase